MLYPSPFREVDLNMLSILFCPVCVLVVLKIGVSVNIVSLYIVRKRINIITYYLYYVII